MKHFSNVLMGCTQKQHTMCPVQNDYQTNNSYEPKNTNKNTVLSSWQTNNSYEPIMTPTYPLTYGCSPTDEQMTLLNMFISETYGKVQCSLISKEMALMSLFFLVNQKIKQCSLITKQMTLMSLFVLVNQNIKCSVVWLLNKWLLWAYYF